ncbi:TfoX/Sxy family protein [Henriciella sp. AS95]|uniref:TfoX/Sxy family protein n=1 Tax=Henriciella sp. AS95 TaxID=3135782 RepID=UPI0031739772
MASNQETADYILGQIEGAGAVSIRKMFGEFGVYCDAKFVGAICDNTLYLKLTEPGRASAPDLDEGSPYPGAKPHLVIDADLLEATPRLHELIRITWSALPAPKPKKKKSTKG